MLRRNRYPAPARQIVVSGALPRRFLNSGRGDDFGLHSLLHLVQRPTVGFLFKRSDAVRRRFKCMVAVANVVAAVELVCLAVGARLREAANHSGYEGDVRHRFLPSLG